MASWQYVETQDYIDSAAKLELSQDVKAAIESWALTASRFQTNKSKMWFRSPQNKFELWSTRIPDPDCNKGSSGGFRLTYFFNLIDNSICLAEIERRKDMGGKSERPKDQQRHTAYIEGFKKYLSGMEEELLENH